ncbi:DUF4271 domain-containing protein [Mangrovibacterium sp.]|uniref:DUF4271 domain-containing protein n=1 Tax=Mangrovibacterium sp. TaxID=1961364 RepID=UPI003563F4E7
MVIKAIPEDSLKVQLSAPAVISNTTRDKGKTIVRQSAAIAPATKKYQLPEKNLQLLEPVQPVNSIQVSLRTTTTAQGLILPERKLETRQTDWTLGILIIVLALFATVRLFFGKYLVQLFHSAVNYTTASRLFRERSVSLTHASFRLDVIFVLTFSLFLFQGFGTGIDFKVDSSFLKYLMVFGGTVLFILGKQFIYSVQGRLNESNIETREILFNMNLYNRILGLGLIPVTLILAFSRIRDPQIVVALGLGMVLVCYVLLVFRGLKILVRKDIPLFYLILYLCTLEILPLFYIYKLVLM